MGGIPILKTLRRNGFMPLLVIAQVVFALVVLVNVGSLLSQQMAPMLAGTGVPKDALLLTRQLKASDAGLNRWSYARIRAAEQAVRALPGVRAVSAGMGAPFMVDHVWLRALPTGARSHRTVAADIFGGDHLVDTLGLHVLRGRHFTTGDYVRGGFDAAYRQTRVVVLTNTLSRRLFPHGGAVGRSIWLSSHPGKGRAPLRVVGVVSDTLGSRITGDSIAGTHAVVLLPYQVDGFPSAAFMVRTQPALRERVMKRLPAVLGRALGMRHPEAMKIVRYEDARNAAIHGSKLMSWLLLAVLATVSSVAVLGITGLSGYWVQKRTREIGIQRALGARRVDIVCQYHLENLLVVCVGVVLGVGLGVSVSDWLHMRFELISPPMLAWTVGSLILVVLGQLAVLGPALRAAAVPPVVATRAT